METNLKNESSFGYSVGLRKRMRFHSPKQLPGDASADTLSVALTHVRRKEFLKQIFQSV